MTIAIVVITHDGHIVAVSDRMISNDNVFQADDAAALKTIRLSEYWHAAFAGDPSAFRKVARKLVARLKDANGFEEHEARRLAALCYEETLREEFAASNLIQLGYKTVEEFRTMGRAELGDVLFNSLTTKLLKADLGLELLVFGLDKTFPHSTRMFEVANPGRVIEHVTGYAAIGSGYHMAMSALRRKPLDPRDLDTVIYRLLDAKFSAETATGVGDTTTVIWLRPDGKARRIDTEEVDRVRKIWKEVMKQPEPPSAIDLIAGFTKAR